MSAYYNENESYAAEWLRNLIAAGHIALGEVDTRSIEDVTPDDLRGFQQCHFFAGIGIWSRALRDAGWPDDRMVWTGSCPCQPFSAAGKGGGFADERHLWPAWFWLIDECRPVTIFGEQVASKPGLAWFDLVSSDLEGAGYAVGAHDLCAAGVGAPHIRQRLWFMAHHQNKQFDRRRDARRRRGEPSDSSDVVDAAVEQEGLSRRTWESGSALGEPAECGRPGVRKEPALVVARPPNEAWSDCDWIDCRDGKRRPVEPATFPLAHGYPSRVGRLRAYGNAICPQVATAFIKASMDALACARFRVQ